jgi:cytochrome c5
MRITKLIVITLALAFGGSISLTASRAAQSDGLPESAGVELVRAQCLNCHESDLIVSQRLSKAGWTRELDKMIRWGAIVKDSDKEPMIEYLTRHFGQRPLKAPTVQTPAAPDVSSVERGKAIYENRCLLCHENDLTAQQRLTRAGWVREVEKMIRWGATVTDAEKDPLVDYLFKNYGPRARK